MPTPIRFCGAGIAVCSPDQEPTKGVRGHLSVAAILRGFAFYTECEVSGHQKFFNFALFVSFLLLTFLRFSR